MYTYFGKEKYLDFNIAHLESMVVLDGEKNK